MKGVVRKSTGSWYEVEGVNGKLYHCRIKGKFRVKSKNLTNPIAVGDIVSFQIEDKTEDRAIITEIGERRNYIVRQSPSKKHSLHLLASNIDQALLIVTLRNPNLKPAFIDRFLLMTEPHDIPVIIVFNKSDIYTEKDWKQYENFKEIYTAIGYTLLSLSAKIGTNLDELRPLLEDKTTLVSGQSGVGKSTLLNSMFPDLNITTTEISQYTEKGQHTTTFAEMYKITPKLRIIDTPGIKSLSFINLTPQDIMHNFREFFDRSINCKFSDCTHREEPGCAVKNAIGEGKISELRYFNYLKILEEVEAQNRWERHEYY